MHSYSADIFARRILLLDVGRQIDCPGGDPGCAAALLVFCRLRIGWCILRRRLAVFEGAVPWTINVGAAPPGASLSIGAALLRHTTAIRAVSGIGWTRLRLERAVGRGRDTDRRRARCRHGDEQHHRGQAGKQYRALHSQRIGQTIQHGALVKRQVSLNLLAAPIKASVRPAAVAQPNWALHRQFRRSLHECT